MASTAFKITPRSVAEAKDLRAQLKAAVVEAMKLTTRGGRLNVATLEATLEKSFARLFDGRRFSFGPIERSLGACSMSGEDIYLTWAVLAELMRPLGVTLSPTSFELGSDTCAALQRRARGLVAKRAVTPGSARGKRLGAIAVERGLLSEEQLAGVLRSQRLHGGRLGTRLVEMGYLEPQALAELLAEQHGVPPCQLEGLGEVSDAARAALPIDVQRRHMVLPLRVQGRVLCVAMADPTDLRLVDQLAFLSGYRLQPMAAPAAAIEACLAEVHRPKLRSLSLAPEQARVEESFEVVHSAPRREPHIDEAATCPSQPGAAGTAIAVEERGSFFDLERSDFPGEADPVRARSVELSKAAIAEEVLSVLHQHLAGRYRRVAAFVQAQGALRGLCSSGCAWSDAELARTELPITAGSMLEAAIAHQRPHLTRGGRGEAERRVLGALGLANAGTLVVPVLADGRLVGAILAGELREGATHDPSCAGLLAKAGLALQLIALRERILAD